jgi:hypothetical protein
MQSSDTSPFENPEGSKSPPENPFANVSAFNSESNPFESEKSFGAPPPPQLSKVERFMQQHEEQPSYVPTLVETATGYEIQFLLQSNAQIYGMPSVSQQIPQIVGFGQKVGTAAVGVASHAGRIVGYSFLTAFQLAVTKFFMEWLAGMTRATMQSAADRGLPVQRIDTEGISYHPNGQAPQGSQQNQNSQSRNSADSPFGAPPRVW